MCARVCVWGSRGCVCCVSLCALEWTEERECVRVSVCLSASLSICGSRVCVSVWKSQVRVCESACVRACCARMWVRACARARVCSCWCVDVCARVPFSPVSVCTVSFCGERCVIFTSFCSFCVKHCVTPASSPLRVCLCGCGWVWVWVWV